MIGALARTLLIVLFIAGAAAIRFARDEKSQRRRITALMLFLIGVQLVVGVSQRDAWPFATYRLLHGRSLPDTLDERNVLVGIDEQGREHALPDATWSPLPGSVLEFWMTHAWPQLDAAKRQAALTFLTKTATTPHHRPLFFEAPRWYSPMFVPQPPPIVALRVVHETRRADSREGWQRKATP
jgi:hypothetical protein